MLWQWAPRQRGCRQSTACKKHMPSYFLSGLDISIITCCRQRTRCKKHMRSHFLSGMDISIRTLGCVCRDCWPAAWLQRDLPDVRLLTVEYAAPASNWEVRRSTLI
jgi:hypothetical protein